MDKAIFGSTSSLGALFSDVINESEADQFLQDLGPTSKGFDFLSGGADKVDVTALGVTTSIKQGSNEVALTSDVPDVAKQITTGNTYSSTPPGRPATFPQAYTTATATAAAAQPDLQAQTSAEALKVLAQLVTLIQKGTANGQQQPSQVQVEPAVTQQLFQSTAFKAATAPIQEFAPVTQATVVSTYPQAPMLPHMTAEQQQVIHNILSTGELGTSTEGKKVRRMLSNRESARRSRHRKQAHVKEVEDRAVQLETENQRLKAVMADAVRLQQKSDEESNRLRIEVAALEAKVARLESCQLHSKASSFPAKGEVLAKRGNSNGSAAGQASEDSSCESMPVKSRPLEESNSENHCCKRCCRRNAA